MTHLRSLSVPHSWNESNSPPRTGRQGMGNISAQQCIEKIRSPLSDSEVHELILGYYGNANNFPDRDASWNRKDISDVWGYLRRYRPHMVGKDAALLSSYMGSVHTMAQGSRRAHAAYCHSYEVHSELMKQFPALHESPGLWCQAAIAASRCLIQEPEVSQSYVECIKTHCRKKPPFFEDLLAHAGWLAALRAWVYGTEREWLPHDVGLPLLLKSLKRSQRWKEGLTALRCIPREMIASHSVLRNAYVRFLTWHQSLQFFMEECRGNRAAWGSGELWTSLVRARGMPWEVLMRLWSNYIPAHLKRSSSASFKLGQHTMNALASRENGGCWSRAIPLLLCFQDDTHTEEGASLAQLAIDLTPPNAWSVALSIATYAYVSLRAFTPLLTVLHLHPTWRRALLDLLWRDTGPVIVPSLRSIRSTEDWSLACELVALRLWNGTDVLPGTWRHILNKALRERAWDVVETIRSWMPNDHEEKMK